MAGVGVELDDAVALGVVHRVGEDGGRRRPGAWRAQAAGEVVAVEEVVAEHQGAGVVADEVGADDEGLGEAVRAGLDGVAEVEPHWLPSPRSCSKRGVSWGVEMMRMSRMPASIRVLRGSRSSACREPG